MQSTVAVDARRQADGIVVYNSISQAATYYNNDTDSEIIDCPASHKPALSVSAALPKVNRRNAADMPAVHVLGSVNPISLNILLESDNT